MKVRVISPFRDKYTFKLHKVGDELEVSKERYNEIKPYVEVIKKKKGQE
jgi:hypothetical protein